MDATRYTDLNTSQRTLLGPGPSMAHPRVLRAHGDAIGRTP